jgi:hypothetical protein
MADVERTAHAYRAPAAPRPEAGDVERLLHAYRASAAPRRPDLLIAELAAAQCGVVAATQLAIAGVARGVVQRRVARGGLIRLHRGVYAVGHAALRAEGRWMAATLAHMGAVLSHASAAALWELRRSAGARIDVTAPRLSGRPSPALRFHRARSLDARDITTHHGIPTTTVARTLLDLAETLTMRQLERAVDQAHVLGLFDADALADTAQRNRGRHGLKPLGALLRAHDPGSTLTKSELEELFLTLCATHGVPRPTVNQRIGDYTPDFAWREAKLVVETDGFATHGSPIAFDDDRRRDEWLTRHGHRVVRLTWRRVRDEPADVAASLRTLLEAPNRPALSAG